jgi:tRNA-Thr(GGU) m(6)t(6)A37 methyltransferase TsaA
LQRHPDQIRQGTFVVDEKDPDRRSVGAVHPWQLAEDGATPLLIAGRRRRHLTILAIPRRLVTKLIDISHVTPDYTLRPIGRIESPVTDPSTAARQPDEGAPACWLAFEPDVTEALDGLTPGDDIVVITWLHLADRTVLQVHPRGDTSRPKRGVFATRSQHRPNPLGIHQVTVLAIEGVRVRVQGLEAVDGTPIIDVKSALGSRGQR